jgi:hypothetical protein
MTTDDIVTKLRNSAYFADDTDLYWVAAEEIERLRKRVTELENNDLVVTGQDGAELCRFSGDEATEIINLAVSLLMETAIKRISNDG